MSMYGSIKAYCRCGRCIEHGVECPCGWTSPPKTYTQADIDEAVAAERQAFRDTLLALFEGRRDDKQPNCWMFCTLIDSEEDELIQDNRPWPDLRSVDKHRNDIADKVMELHRARSKP